MDPDDIALVKASWQRIAPLSSMVGEIFYGRLFALAPDVRRLFASDLSEQSAKLMDTLAVVVEGLDDIDSLDGELRALARRHNGFGARPEHYEAVGTALVDTLRTTAVPPLNAAELAAWRKAYALISGVMLQETAAS